MVALNKKARAPRPLVQRHTPSIWSESESIPSEIFHLIWVYSWNLFHFQVWNRYGTGMEQLSSVDDECPWSRLWMSGWQNEWMAGCVLFCHSTKVHPSTPSGDHSIDTLIVSTLFESNDHKIQAWDDPLCTIEDKLETTPLFSERKGIHDLNVS